MVKEGIVLGLQISNKGIEVDQAKIEVIEKLPPHISIKRMKFKFDKACFKEFEWLKEKLISAHITISLD
ncbi:hypothetical protein MTR67_051521 [Solanum verrucosum]|uniref:Reverse transcriptase n=1 Tax=Solanum verrucosum TaxID=315347 RepID=A0AAF0V7L5_SOLVR|nr:hypothetical protein MTR67_051521 [Solanum verrucosum]